MSNETIETRGAKLERLTNPNTSLEERILLTRQLFPEQRKAELIKQADMDSKDRPVRYFRLVTYEELKMILASMDSNSTSSQYLQESFNRQSDEIKKALRYFLESEGIYEEYRQDFEGLESDFTLENYRNFVQGRLPRIILFKLHISSSGGGRFSGLTGLTSLSVGAPYQPPYDPSKERVRNQEGLPVIEMVIPSGQIHVHPLFKSMNIEMEKEVDVTDIKPEWIVDIYHGAEDFADRFIKDPSSVLDQVYKEKIADDKFLSEYISRNNIWDILQEWKRRESIAELIPREKLSDIDESNPELLKPLSVR